MAKKKKKKAKKVKEFMPFPPEVRPVVSETRMVKILKYAGKDGAILALDIGDGWAPLRPMYGFRPFAPGNGLTYDSLLARHVSSPKTDTSSSE